jgi:hypothetical protein
VEIFFAGDSIQRGCARLNRNVPLTLLVLATDLHPQRAVVELQDSSLTDARSY